MIPPPVIVWIDNLHSALGETVLRQKKGTWIVIADKLDLFYFVINDHVEIVHRRVPEEGPSFKDCAAHFCQQPLTADLAANMRQDLLERAILYLDRYHQPDWVHQWVERWSTDSEIVVRRESPFLRRFNLGNIWE